MSFDPLTLALVSMGTQAVGTVVSGIAGSQAAGDQAQVADRNAELARQNAQSISTQSQAEGQDTGESAGADIATIMARRAASGVLAAGSPSLYIDAARRLAARDQLRIREQGQSDSRQALQDAANFEGEAGMARREARNGMLSTFLDLGSSLVGGAQSVNRIRLGV